MSSTKTHSRPKIMDPLLVPGCELIIPMKSESNFSQIQTGLFQEIFQIEDKGLNTLRTCIIINKKSLIKDCHDFQLHNIRFFIKTNI